MKNYIKNKQCRLEYYACKQILIQQNKLYFFHTVERRHTKNGFIYRSSRFCCEFILVLSLEGVTYTSHEKILISGEIRMFI